jgi:hypothetical protein
MAILHVAVTGRDRRHLSGLRNKFRVVVVGARETRRGIVVMPTPVERSTGRKKGAASALEGRAPVAPSEFAAARPACRTLET